MLITGFLALLMAQSADTGPTRLNLICSGGGTANKADVRTGTASDNWGNTAQAQSYGTRSVGFDDAVSLWIDGDAGKIRMPRSMLPALHGGDDGWFELRNVRMSSTEIVANAAVNVLNKPKVVIDRMAGTITISGKAGNYMGRCEAYDPAAAKPKF